MKVCTKCLKEKSLSDFSPDERHRDGLQSQCKKCICEANGTVWEIDHKIPVAIFNFEKPEHIDFRLCWNLKNLQPLEKEKNRAKSAKIEEPFQPSFAFG